MIRQNSIFVYALTYCILKCSRVVRDLLIQESNVIPSKSSLGFILQILVVPKEKNPLEKIRKLQSWSFAKNINEMTLSF